MHWEQRWQRFASTQSGLIARFHVHDLDGTKQQWWRARRNGRWDAHSSRVLGVRGAPETEVQRALAAVLDASPGAVLHGRSALAWFGLGGFDLREIHVGRPFALSGRRPELATLHQLRDFKPHHVVVTGGVPTEHPLRAIWVEASRYAAPSQADLGALKIGRLLDDAHRKGLVTWAALHEMVNDIHRRGRSGTTIMRALAEARTPGSSPTESRNEEQFETIVTDAGLPKLRRQIVVGGYEPIGRIDFRGDELPLAVEVNSLTFHTTPSDRNADILRYRRLNDAGFTVAVMWEPDLWRQPADVVRTMVRARTDAKAGRRQVHHSPSCPWPESVLLAGCRAAV